MTYICVPTELWNTSLMPEGLLERWLVEDGAAVKAGDPVACVRINENLHEVMAPVAGRVTAMSALNSMVDPGSAIAEVRV
jgi:biotin carboxyl carrier protein